ncbi:hypothetical protein RCOM_0775400 [Ricinus communis]|uniref:BHLH domain-containing protein n=1 Tax=Ricinus communis TaxID=3988 RepID=B9S7A5_RICCO|nr:hypothetical protein RCOM_0775400 [Ricinus communis]
MAQECSGSSVAISSSTPPAVGCWWDLHHHHASSLSPWHQPNPSSNSSCEEDVSMSTSFTNASNHSGLTVESSRRLVEPAASSPNELIGEHASDSQLWSHILLGVGSNGELQNNQDVGENLLDALSSRSINSSGIFEPACDYLKKIDHNWEFTSSFNNFEKHINGFSTDHHHQSLIESDQRVTKLSNLVENDHEHQNHHRHVEAPAAGYVLRRSTFNNNGAGVGYHIGLNNGSVMADNSKYYYGTTENTSARTFNDGLTFNGRLNKPLIDIQGHKPCFKSLNLSDCRKQGLQASSQTVRGQGNSSEGKKKRYEDTSETIPKKPKHESSTASSVKTQAPKVKLGDRITALQQIVSPFGKTDTASVLLEAIQYIKFLQEQVQLLSNPYMKSNSHKDPWGGLDKKAQGDAKVDLRSRGLCLVPISCTPQIYHENTGSDYWTPTYRGCLYR